jgi:hypothetical protein
MAPLLQSNTNVAVEPNVAQEIRFAVIKVPPPEIGKIRAALAKTPELAQDACLSGEDWLRVSRNAGMAVEVAERRS